MGAYAWGRHITRARQRPKLPSPVADVCQGGYCNIWDGTGLVDTTYMAACMVVDRSMGDLAHSALVGGCVLSGMTHL
jgi:hypothetical protein